MLRAGSPAQNRRVHTIMAGSTAVDLRGLAGIAASHRPALAALAAHDGEFRRLLADLDPTVG